MPGMDGKEVYHGLRTINANANATISSGYDSEVDDLLNLGAAGYAWKPYLITELI